MTDYLFSDIVIGTEGLLKGPFGSDLKKSLYVPKGEDTYKVYLQENILTETNDAGNHYISKDYFDEKMSRYQVKENDFIVTCDGTLGEIYQLKNITEPGIISSSLLRITVNPEIVDYDYFYYLFKALIKWQLIRQGNNSVLKHLPGLGVIRNLPISLPSLEEQKKIGNTLKNIDDKIKNNNSIISELESMAKTLYDYWFLQFEFPNEEGKPYKSSGGKMVWNEELKRDIPEGWLVGNLYDIATFTNGLACQKYRPTDDTGALPVIKITEMHDGITNKTEHVRDDIDSKYIINDGDILFSWSATLEVMFWNNGKGGLNQHIFKIEPKGSYNKCYVFSQLSAYVINFVKMAEARKTTMGHITSDHLKQSRIPLPPIKLANIFEKNVSKIFDNITNLANQNKELKQLRDFLLPMLMNGQVTFKKEGESIA